MVVRLVAQLIAITGVIFSTDLYVGIWVNILLLAQFILVRSALLTVVAVAGVTNAFNLIDGINGLCGGLLLVPLVALAFLCGENCVGNFSYLVAMIASLISFLFLNLINNPKFNLFMGDAGSTGLGFIITFLIIYHIRHGGGISAPPLALWMLLIPIMDTLHVATRRVMSGRSIFLPGSDHFHHRLIKIGFSQKQHLRSFCFVRRGSIGYLNAMNDVVSITYS